MYYQERELRLGCRTAQQMCRRAAQSIALSPSRAHSLEWRLSDTQSMEV
jgi:hypothetical protein